MKVKFKCPDCENSVMALDEEKSVHVCPDCEKTFNLEEAEAAFIDGSLVMAEDDDDEALNQDDENLEEDDNNDDNNDDDENLDETFNGWSNKDTWAVHLVATSEFKLFKEARAILNSDSEDKIADMKAFATKLQIEDVEIEDVNFEELIENFETSITEMKEITDSVISALSLNEEMEEDTRNEVANIFETALAVKLAEVRTTLEEENAEKLETALDEKKEELLVQMDAYLSRVVTEWMEENKIAIEHGIRTEMTEKFMEELHDLFKRHYIEIPDDRYDVVEGLSNQVDSLTAQLNEASENAASLTEQLQTRDKQIVIDRLSEGLAETDVERLAKLAESLDYESEDKFEASLQALKATFLTEAAPKKTGDNLNEDVITDDDENIDDGSQVIDENDEQGAAIRKAAGILNRAN